MHQALFVCDVDVIEQVADSSLFKSDGKSESQMAKERKEKSVPFSIDCTKALG